MGRPSDYTPEIATLICSQIAEGRSLRSIIRDNDSVPTMVTIFNWMANNETFLNQYTRAREQQADAFADEMQDIADNPTGDYQRDRLRVDTRKWIASKLKPKKYGDKIEVEHAGTVKHVTQLTDEELEKIAAMGKPGDKDG